MCNNYIDVFSLWGELAQKNKLSKMLPANVAKDQRIWEELELCWSLFNKMNVEVLLEIEEEYKMFNDVSID